MIINIRPLLEQKNMRRHELAQLIDVTYPTITSIYNSTSTSIKFDILEKICKVLECTPNDILVWDNENTEIKYPNSFNEDSMNLPR